MSKHQPFVIPAGVSLDLTDRGISVSHLGDIILQSSLGDRMDAVVSKEGSVTLRGKFELDRVEAPRGTVRLEGSVKARAVKGAVVEIVASKFECTSVQGEKQVVLGATRIRADVLVAPRIDIDAKAVGRVPIIECRNEPGPNAIKGGFSVAEYDELLGNVESYLAERGVEPLEPGDEDEEQEDDEEPSDVVIEAYAADEAELEALDEEEDSDSSEQPHESTEDPDTYTDSGGLGVRVGTAAPVEPVIVEATSDVVAVTAEDTEQPSIPEVEPDALTPIETEDLQLPPGARADGGEEQPANAAVIASQISQVDETFEDLGPEVETDESHTQLLEILAELRSCYDEAEQPPVLTDLAELVEDRQYDDIVANLSQIWNDLVKYHRERGLRIRRQVTTTFNNIMTIVKNAPSVTLGQQ